MEISILELVRQYTAFVEAAHRLKIELRADYLIMAAWLALLKSRLLIKAEEEGDAADMAADLALRLKRLEAMREAAKALFECRQLGHDRFPRGQPEAVEKMAHTKYAPTLLQLLQAYAGMKSDKDFRPYQTQRIETYSVDFALKYLQRMLGKAVDWTELSRLLPAEWRSEPQRTRAATAGTFAACLELAKRGDVDLKQDWAFGPVQLRSRRADGGR